MPSSTTLNNMACTVDGLIRYHQPTDRGKYVLAYPLIDGEPSSYEYYDLARISETVDRVAACLLQHGASPQITPFQTTAAILAPSGLELLMTACALSRLGYTVLILSPRLASLASSALMRQVNCQLLFVASHYWKSCQKLREAESPARDVRSMPSRASWPSANEIPVTVTCDHSENRDILDKTAFILHSSGSTGLPKPIFTSHRRYIENAKNSFSCSALVTLPLYHAYGFASFFRAVAGRTLLVLPHSMLPLTAENVVDTLQLTQPQMLSVVPFTLKLLSEFPKAWNILKDLQLVTFHGSACPDEVGNLLIKQGVHLVAHMGSTEAGALATSDRPKGDPSWNYLRFLPSVKPYVVMKPVSKDIFELILLDGLRTKVLSNSDDPPNSLHTRDLFRRHMDIAEAWYYLGRQDDRITLANGEKVLPLPIESHVMESSLVRQALVFGVGKDYPGMLVFRSSGAATMDDQAFLQKVWPWIARANSMAESFAQITRPMTVLLSAETAFPRTDKGSVIRAQTYLAFHEQTEHAYDQMNRVTGPKSRHSPLQMRKFLLKLCHEELGMLDINLSSDLLQSGLDSLKGTQMLSYLKKHTQAQDIGLQQIYRARDLGTLADSLCEPSCLAPTDGGFQDHSSHAISVQGLIGHYGTFGDKMKQTTRANPSEKVLLLTGATGSLGSHILAKALLDASYNHVYCLTRLSSGQDPIERVLQQLQKQHVRHTTATTENFTVLPAELSHSMLGLDKHMYEFLQQHVTHIIHAAWTVNFTQPLSAFVPTHIAGTRNLLNLSLSTRNVSNFALCSSIAVGSRWSHTGLVPETLITDFEHTSDTGYGQSKLVAEYIVARARDTGAKATVLRVGQVIGSLTAGIWNDSESVPLMVRSALTVPAPSMPAIPGSVSWLPVDICAAVVLELCDCASDRGVYNVSNPRLIRWTEEFLPALSDAGISFTVVSPAEWTANLRTYGDTLGNSAVIQNPAVKLLDFWTQRYGNGTGSKRDVQFDTREAQHHSAALREFASLQDLSDIMNQGYVRRFVETWRESWGK